MSSVLLNIATSKIPNVTNGIWTSDNVTINFYPPLTLPSNYSYDVGLARVDTWNSIHNIKAVYNNNTLRYSPDTGTTWKTLVLPDGNYEIEDIDTALKNFMYDNGDFNNTNPASPVFYINFERIIAEGKLRIQLSSTYQIDLSIGDIHTLLGFNAVILTATAKGPNVVDITRGVDSWSIHCSLCGGSYDNDVASDVIYGFVPMSTRGYAISEIPPPQTYFFPISDSYMGSNGLTINSITMALTDQLNRPILLNGENITYRVIIRPSPAANVN